MANDMFFGMNNDRTVDMTADYSFGSERVQQLLRGRSILKDLGIPEDLHSRMLSVALAGGRSPSDVATDVRGNMRFCLEQGLDENFGQVDPRVVVSYTGLRYASALDPTTISTRIKEVSVRERIPFFLAADILYLACREQR